MTIPPIATEINGNRRYFDQMYKLFVDMGMKKYDNIKMEILSMGMSADYEEAILAGANMLRIGSAIFGPQTCYIIERMVNMGLFDELRKWTRPYDDEDDFEGTTSPGLRKGYRRRSRRHLSIPEAAYIQRQEPRRLTSTTGARTGATRSLTYTPRPSSGNTCQARKI